MSFYILNNKGEIPSFFDDTPPTPPSFWGIGGSRAAGGHTPGINNSHGFGKAERLRRAKIDLCPFCYLNLDLPAYS
jgi:hypothetical protein